jgi:hypothetical protein
MLRHASRAYACRSCRTLAACRSEWVLPVGREYQRRSRGIVAARRAAACQRPSGPSVLRRPAHCQCSANGPSAAFFWAARPFGGQHAAGPTRQAAAAVAPGLPVRWRAAHRQCPTEGTRKQETQALTQQAAEVP